MKTFYSLALVCLFTFRFGFSQEITYAKGFEITPLENGIKRITVSKPWPDAQKKETYLLVPRDSTLLIHRLKSQGETVIPIPVKRVVMTSTTQIPALEILNKTTSLVGFTGLDYISSVEIRKAIYENKMEELGANELINIEKTIALVPEVVFGFSINGQNKAYEELKSFGIPVVINGDWVEDSPLAKAEWIKFTAAFFNDEKVAQKEFKQIETSYAEAKSIAAKATEKPIVLSGSLYQDIWYAPAGKSWGAQFIEDAHASYVFASKGTHGSLYLSLEEVIQSGTEADFWIAPAQFTSYPEMEQNNVHYTHFKAFKNKKVYTYSLTKGETGGILYFELASQRPDLVLKDLIYIFHSELLKEYRPTFFKALLND